MEPIAHALTFAATIGLGLMTGALLAEGAILVPFWRASPPEEFLVWYRKHSALLQNFFGPLEIGAGLITIAATAAKWAAGGPVALLALATLLAIAVLAVFPVYFQRANTSFRAGTIAVERVSGELRVWSAWHWGRTVLSLAAFGGAAAAL